MPVTITNLTKGSGSGTSATSASVSPASNKLLLLTVHSRTGSSNEPNQPTITAFGLTWVAVLVHYWDDTSSSRRKMTVFRALGASPTSGTVSIDFAGQSQTSIAWILDELSGIDTGGTNGSAAIVQSAKNANGLTGTNVTVTLSAFADVANATYGAFGTDGPDTWTAGSGFTISDTTNNGVDISVMTEFKNSNDTTVDATLTGGGGLAVIGIEIKAASGTSYNSTLTETITLVDSVVKQPSRILTDVVTLVDSIIKQPVKVLTEAIVTVDSILKRNGRTFSEVVTVKDTDKASLFFDGQDYVNLNDVFDLAYTGKISISAFIYPTSIAGMGIVSKQQRINPFQGWGFYTRSDGKLLFEYVSASGNVYQVATSAAVITANQLQHVGVTYDARTIVFYHNGKVYSNSVLSGGGSATYSNNPNFNIGNRNNDEGAGDNDYKGYLDDIKLYEGVILTSTDMEDLAQRESIATAPTAWWDFDNSIVDKTGNGYTGTLTGGAYSTTNITRRLAISVTRPLSEAVSLVDTIIRTANRTLSEVVSLVQDFIFSLVIVREYSETVTIDDVFQKQSSRTLTEQISIVDAITRLSQKVLTEVLRIRDGHWTSFFLNGTSTKIALTQNSGLPLYTNSAFSISGKAKPTGVSTNVIYGEGRSTNGNPVVELAVVQAGAFARFRYQVRTDAGAFLLLDKTSSTLLNVGQEYSFVLVDDNGDVHLYIDGAEDAATVSNSWNYTRGTLTLDRCTIGALTRTTTTNYFLGYLGDIRLYSKGLSATEALNESKDILTDNLVAQYDFSEGTGTTLTDLTGNGNTGTITSGTWVRTMLAIISKTISETITVLDTRLQSLYGVTLDGSGMFGAFVNPTRTAGQPFAAMIWVKTTSAPASGNRVLIGARNGSSAGDLWKLQENTNGSVTFEYDTVGLGGTAQGAAGTVVNDGNVHLVTGIYTGSVIKVMGDGVVTGTPLTGKPSAFIDTVLGGFGYRPDSGGEKFIGTLGEAIIFKRAPTEAEILKYYNTGIIDMTDAYAYWLANEGSGSTRNDVVGHHDITLTGYPPWDLTLRQIQISLLIKSLSRALTDSLSLVDSVLRTIQHVMQESITIVDTVIRTVQKTYTEIITVQDIISRTISHTLQEAITLVDSVLRSINHVIEEAITITDTFTSRLIVKIKGLPTFLYSKFTNTFLSSKNNKTLLQQKKKSGWK